MYTRIYGILIFIFIYSFMISCTIPDNQWTSNKISEKNKEGWILIHSQYKGKRLAFIQPDKIRKIGEYFVITTLWLNHPDVGGNQYPEDAFTSIYDFTNKRDVFLKDGINSLNHQDKDNFNWKEVHKDDIFYNDLVTFLKNNDLLINKL